MTRIVWAAIVAAAVSAGPAWGCFGPRLRVAVVPEVALAAYVFGYYVEDRAGTGVEFVDAAEPGAALLGDRADVAVVPADRAPPEGVETRAGGEVAGFGPVVFWLRPQVFDDLRFTLVERALGKVPPLWTSGSFRSAGDRPPKAAARQVVLDAP